VSRFKRFIKWLLFAALPASQPRSSLDNVQNSEKNSEFISRRIDLIGSLLCSHLLCISNRTPSSFFEGEAGQEMGVSDDAGDFSWSRADYLDTDSDSDEIGVRFISDANFLPIFNNDDHRYRSCEINPANGLPMLDDCIDILGNPYGSDFSDSGLSFWDSDSTNLFEDDGFGSSMSFDNMGSTDPWDS